MSLYSSRELYVLVNNWQLVQSVQLLKEFELHLCVYHRIGTVSLLISTCKPQTIKKKKYDCTSQISLKSTVA